jgi:hypothetical protein
LDLIADLFYSPAASVRTSSQGAYAGSGSTKSSIPGTGGMS